MDYRGPVAYSTAEARQELLDEVALATDDLGVALAALGEAYEQLDEATGDRLEEALFRPVQLAYGRAKRTHTEFAARVGSPRRTFVQPEPGHPSQGVRGFIDAAVSATTRADDRLGQLQDSMRPVDVGRRRAPRRALGGPPPRRRRPGPRAGPHARPRSLSAPRAARRGRPRGAGPRSPRAPRLRLLARDGPDDDARRRPRHGDAARDMGTAVHGRSFRRVRWERSVRARRARGGRRRDDEVRARTAGAARGPVRGAAGAGRANGRVSDRS